MGDTQINTIEGLDQSLFDEKTLEILGLTEADIDKTESTSENAEIIKSENEEYVSNSLGISMNAIEQGLEMRKNREVKGLDNYYKDVFENVIQPNKGWNEAVYQDGLKLMLEKHGEDATPGYVDDETLFEAAKLFIDNMYEYNPNVQQAFSNYKTGIEENTKGEEAMLLSGISNEESMAIWPRMIVELLGPNVDPKLKKSLLTTVLQKQTADPEAQIEVGTFKELTKGTYKGDTPDALAYRINGGLITPVNIPGLDTKDISLFLRELPNIAASITAGATMIATGYGIPATAAASASAVAVTELVTQGLGFAYEKYNTTGDVTQEQIINFLKDASKDAAFAAALEGTFGVIIPGVATLIKRSINKGKIAPRKLRTAYEQSIKGGQVPQKEIDELRKINDIMTERLGKNPNSSDGTWIDLNILQVFKGSIPVTKAAADVMSNVTLTATDIAAAKIVKQTSEAFQQVFAKNIDESVTPGMLPDFTASPTILFGETFQKLAKEIGEVDLKTIGDSFIKPIDELTAILNVVNKSNVLENPNAVFDKSMINTGGQEILTKLIQEGNNEIASIFTTSGFKLSDKLVKPLQLKATAYQFLKSIKDVKALGQLDEAQTKVLKAIIDDVSIITKNSKRTPGQDPTALISYNKVDSLLTKLNEIIDNPTLYGGVGKNNKVLLLAGSLRDDLEKGLRKNLGDDNWLKIKGKRSELKAINDLRKGELFKKILKSDEFFTDQNGGAFFKSVKNNSKVLAQMNSVFNRMPSLGDQKMLFKMGILDDLRDALDGPTGDMLEMAIKNKDFKYTSNAYKTWMKANRKNIAQFFTEEEMKILDSGGIKAVNYLETLTKKRGNIMEHVKRFTGRLEGMDPQNLLDFFKKNPAQFAKFYKEGIEKKIFNKDAMMNFKKYVAMTFNNKTMGSNGDGLFLYDPDAMAKEILDAPDFYRAVFGEKWLNDALEMSKFLNQYYKPIRALIGSGENQAGRRALQNVFMGQLDRKRTFIRGTLNLLGIYDARQWAKFVSWKDFKKGYDNAYLSKTSRIFLEPINAITAADERTFEPEKGEALINRIGTTGAQTMGMAIGAGNWALEKGGNFLENQFGSQK